MMFRIDIMLRFKCKARNHQYMYYLKFGLCEKFIYFRQNGLKKMGWKNDMKKDAIMPVKSQEKLKYKKLQFS